MVWAVLALLGVPLWLCALGILSLVVRNRQLRERYGDIPVRMRRPGKERWTARTRDLGLGRVRLARFAGGLE